MAEQERWIRVTSESELAPGMVVRIEACRECARTIGVARGHRFMLMGRAAKRAYRDGWHVPWLILPHKPCRYRDVSAPGAAVAEGRLYRLDTGLDAEADHAQGRKDMERPSLTARHRERMRTKGE